jgi:hypothetical protein
MPLRSIIPGGLALLFLGFATTASAAQYVLEHNSDRINVDIDYSLSDESGQAVLSWINAVSQTLAAVYGQMPRPELNVEVRPVSGDSSGPVPWAQVKRGNTDTITFYIDALATEGSLIKDWTAYHEFSHLLIPYRGWGDLWFSEGLASYYQNLLQARSGQLTEQQMWQRLSAALERGRGDNRYPHLSLAQLSPRMRETSSFMRVYWSGALFWLRADIELRSRESDNKTLDGLLGQLNACCAEHGMSAFGIAQKLDQLDGHGYFVSLFKELASSHAIPEYTELLSQLGVSIGSDTFILDDNAPLAGIRSAIAQ